MRVEGNDLCFHPVSIPEFHLMAAYIQSDGDISKFAVHLGGSPIVRLNKS